eukprot:TRINITY_DN2693_c0_g1_i2.p2 TRINITY_DN2693_c0_g1~~TRINITY_DN2693_c0_g1_i2.p2  ORF type:complete len:328 (-),score=41.97 TRINITY_DN2693_c0_g1_i2:381-1364(-)
MYWESLWAILILTGLLSACLFFVGFIDWLRKLEQERRDNNGVPAFFKDPNTGESHRLPTVFDTATKYLTIVLPAYNEKYRIPQTLDEILSYLSMRQKRSGSSFTYEVIVVDDGSTDRTDNVVYKYVQQHGLDTIRLISYRPNRGKGFAVKAGLMSAMGQYVLMADSDGATPIRELEQLEKQMSASNGNAQVQKTNIGIVLGSRAHLQTKAVAQRTAIRNFLMRGFHFLVMSVVGNEILDSQCGFKLYTREAVAEIFPNIRLQRWCQDVEIIYVAQQLGIAMKEVAVNWTEMPGSKIKFTSILHMALEIVGLKVAYSWLKLWRVKRGQ